MSTGRFWPAAELQITVGAAAEAYFFAEGEITARGTVEGSYLETQVEDNAYEALTEEIKAGRWSVLEHAWTFNVTGNASVVFKVQAHHSENFEGDDFIFAYSLDNMIFNNMLVVSKTQDDNSYQSFELPSYISGTIYVRVMDTDSAKGNVSPDTLYVDDMFITTSGAAGVPEPAFDPDPPDGATNVATDVILSWSSGAAAAWHDVYLGTDPENLPLVSAEQTGTSFNPGPLQEATSYFWRIDEGNSTGTTVGNQWQFTTHTGGCTVETVSVASIVTATLKGPAGTSYGQAVVTIVDNCGDPVPGASVSGSFTGDSAG